MTVRFFEIEELYYSFDYDPITRWKKWTNNYSPVYWIQNRRLSLLGRFLRMFIGYVSIGVVFFLLACLFGSPIRV